MSNIKDVFKALEILGEFLKDLDRDPVEKIIKSAWKEKFWPQHIEPELNKILIKGKPFKSMVTGKPKIIDTNSGETTGRKQYTVDLVFAIDPKNWQGDAIQILRDKLYQIQNSSWNSESGERLVRFDECDFTYRYTKSKIQDLVISISIIKGMPKYKNVSLPPLTKDNSFKKF